MCGHDRPPERIAGVPDTARHCPDVCSGVHSVPVHVAGAVGSWTVAHMPQPSPDNTLDYGTYNSELFTHELFMWRRISGAGLLIWDPASVCATELRRHSRDAGAEHGVS